jgi:hypothetical protein
LLKRNKKLSRSHLREFMAIICPEKYFDPSPSYISRILKRIPEK